MKKALRIFLVLFIVLLQASSCKNGIFCMASLMIILDYFWQEKTIQMILSGSMFWISGRTHFLFAKRE